MSGARCSAPGTTSSSYTQVDAQTRGMLKTVGLMLGMGNSDALAQRAEELTQGHPVMSSLAEVRHHIAMQVAALDRGICPSRP
jgi:transposase